jgi:hypothetical protein
MKARLGLIPPIFLVLVLSLILVSCSGGGSEAPPSLTAPANQPEITPPPPPPAGLVYRTDTALVRSQTDGNGPVTLTNEPATIATIIVSDTSLIYEVPQNQSNTGNVPRDILAVQIDGRDRHLVRRSSNTQLVYLLDVIGPWVLHTVDTTRPDLLPPPSIASILINGTAPRILSAAVGSGEIWQVPTYEHHVGGRAIIGVTGNYFSLLPDGTDLRQLTTYPQVLSPIGNEQIQDFLVGVSGSVGGSIIYSTMPNPSDPEKDSPKLFAVPVLGGPTVKLGEGPDYEFLTGVVENRVIYNRCVLTLSPDLDVLVDQCNAFSVIEDGRGRVALTATHDINYVQGTIGEQVIIRRSQRGGTTDSLFSIPVSGGTETPLLALNAQHEFVVGIVNDRVILNRTTGLWSIKADGSALVQLTDRGEKFPVIGSAGPFACFTRGPALWCVPADGSAPATKVTDQGEFVTGL